MKSILEFIEEKIITARGHVNPHIAKRYEAWFKENNFKDELNIILNLTNFLPEDAPFKERIYCIRNNITDRVKCMLPTCNNDTNFHNSVYQQYCSIECRSLSEETKIKTKNTCIEKYGADNISKSNFGRKKISESLKGNKKTIIANKTIVYNRHKENFHAKAKNANLEIKSYSAEINGEDRILKCKECENEFKLGDFKFLSNGLRCPFCLPKRESKLELIICKFLKDLGVDYLRNDRKTFGCEIDILIPEFKLGIEIDGILWHSFGKSKYSYLNNYEKENKNHLLEKRNILKEEGYTLLRFTDIEINNPVKLEIIKSFINGKLGLHKKIFARKCELRSISQSELNSFLENNHLIGPINSKIKYGLFHNNELVMIASFGKKRFSKTNDWELYRLCSKNNYTIVGGFSKLIKRFKKDYPTEKLYSFIDMRFSTGKGFEKIGFKIESYSPPNYFYFNRKTKDFKKRYQAQKHKLSTFLEFFDENLSETENMYNHDYRKFYDCGNIVMYY